MPRKSSALGPVLGRVLRAERRKADLSQEQLAFESGLDRTYISMIERGVSLPSLGVLERIAEVLGARVSDLLRAAEDALEAKRSRR